VDRDEVEETEKTWRGRIEIDTAEIDLTTNKNVCRSWEYQMKYINCPAYNYWRSRSFTLEFWREGVS
jgi:hypothetical protein